MLLVSVKTYDSAGGTIDLGDMVFDRMPEIGDGIDPRNFPQRKGLARLLRVVRTEEAGPLEDYDKDVPVEPKWGRVHVEDVFAPGPELTGFLHVPIAPPISSPIRPLPPIWGNEPAGIEKVAALELEQGDDLDELVTCLVERKSGGAVTRPWHPSQKDSHAVQLARLMTGAIPLAILIHREGVTVDFCRDSFRCEVTAEDMPLAMCRAAIQYYWPVDGGVIKPRLPLRVPSNA